MKAKWLLMPMAALTVTAAVYGGYIRTTLTDYTEEGNWEEYQVAPMPEAAGLDKVRVMREYLPQSPYILRVEVLGDLELTNGIGQQKVKVAQVYAGDGLETGQEFYLYDYAWNVGFFERYKSLERGYVNVLEVGREYLVFLNGKIDTLVSPVPVYRCMEGVRLSDDNWIDFMSPIFCYDQMENVPVVYTGDWETGVTYTQGRDNEFFGETEKLIEAWEQMKEEFLQMYPR